VLELGGFAGGGDSDTDRDRVRYCFTDRTGGVSSAPYDGLNLSMDVGDLDAAVTSNRAALLSGLRATGLDEITWLRAEHGAVAVQVVAGGVVPERCDALVTSRAGLGLAALSADCALIVLADPHAGVVGVAHCGRPGLVEGVVGTAVAALRRLGAMHIQAAVGPTICANCYPLPREMAAAVAAAVPAAAVRPGQVDVRTGVVAQLVQEGVVSTTLVGGCTREDLDLFSYRRDGTTGRMAAVGWLTR
jgi:YfiH family protein